MFTFALPSETLGKARRGVGEVPLCWTAVPNLVLCRADIWQYNEVWAEDAVDPDSAPSGGESVRQVAHRVGELLRKVDAKHDG